MISSFPNRVDVEAENERRLSHLSHKARDYDATDIPGHDIEGCVYHPDQVKTALKHLSAPQELRLKVCPPLIQSSLLD